MTSPIDPAAVAARLARIGERIARVERGWDHPVSITAVTKGFGPEAIDAAVSAGCDRVGENYAQELLAKRAAIDAIDVERRPRVDFIGRLQSNKVRQLVDVVDRFATVDRESLAAEIAKRRPGALVLVQVNATEEPQKGGCPPAEVPELVERCGTLGLVVEGLMTVGPTGRPAEDARPAFEQVRSLVDRLGLTECSMGMTDDLEVAVACGSTNVRIGRALFGPRPARPSTPTDGV